jgi:hypothetical protein
MKVLFISVLLLIVFFVFKQIDPPSLTFLNISIISINVVLLYMIFMSLRELFATSRKFNH